MQISRTLMHLCAVGQADVEAWAKVQPPPKAKGKPTPEWLAASKVSVLALDCVSLDLLVVM